MAEVQINNITKRYGDTTALNDLSLTVHDREFFSLLGPSGCGKTTLLNIIAGLVEPSAGQIVIDGRDVSYASPKDREIAMVFQDYALYPHMTVLENLAFPLKARKLARGQIAAKVEEASVILGIRALHDRMPRELSGGQRQRVALGRALVRSPKVFLMDEPLSNLDARLRVQMRTELKRLHQQLEATVIYVTHDQAEAMTLSDRIALLSQGELQQVGGPKDMYDRPSNRFVGSFLGAISMNQVEGVLETRGSASAFVSGQFRYELLSDLQVAVAGLSGQHPLWFGIHAEHVDVTSRPLPEAVAARVEVSEQMGADQYLLVNVSGWSLMARVTPEFKAEVGQEVYVKLPPERVFLFDGSTDERLS